jgi:hypothetical protein
LDDLADISDDESLPSDDDVNSVSTAVILAERRRLKRLKKKDKRKARLKALALQDIDEAPTEEHSPEEAYRLLQQNGVKLRAEKSSLRDSSSTKSEGVKKFHEARDKYDVGSAFPLVAFRTFRNSLDSDATGDHLSLKRDPDGKTQIASFDAESRISRFRKDAKFSSQHEDLEDKSRGSYISRSRLIQPEGRVNTDIATRVGSENNPIDIVSGNKNAGSWHSRRELFSSNMDSIRLQKSDPFPHIDFINSKEKGLTTRSHTSNGYLSHVNVGQQKYRSDLRDDEEDVWALDETKRSELEDIRQKKIDRQQALDRIRAIKARIAKLEH